MARVRLRGVHKSFGQVEVIRDVDLEIAEGELVVFVGSSGCGKSTLLRLIAGLEEVTAGEIWIGDREVTQLPPAARGVAMIFQSYALYPHMTAYQNIAFALSLAKKDRAGVDRRVRDVAAMLHISELLDRHPRQLSGGQRQRVAIARAIVRQPEVFLFDEPLSNLDAALRAHTRLEIAKMHRDLGATMIHVTHDQLEAMTLGDRIVLLNAGGIEQVGTPAELYHRPATRFAAGFMGSPTMNLFPVTVAGQRARLPSGDELSTPGYPDVGMATLGVRPEHVRLAGPAEVDALPAEVVFVEDVGEGHIVHASLRDGALVTCRSSAESHPQPREAVRLGIAPRHQHLFNADGRRIEPPQTTA
jgi:ABC-type sugar transport system ATPase subunit